MVLSGFLVAMDESRRQTEKFFGAAVFQKCCRGVGEQPTFAKQTIFCNLFSLAAIAFLETYQFTG